MSLLWSKGSNPDSKVSEFTVGKDRELDLQMAGFDIEGSIAHVNMIASILPIAANLLARCWGHKKVPLQQRHIVTAIQVHKGEVRRW